MKNWINCETDRVRELSFTDLPATEVVAEAITSCRGKREEWVQSQISPGVSQDMAEDVASGADINNISFFRNYVLDLREVRAEKKAKSAE